MDGLLISRQLSLPALFHEAEIDGLEVPHPGHQIAQRMRAAPPFGPALRRYRSEWRRVGQLLVAQHADHLLDEVFFELQIKAPSGRRDMQLALAFATGQAQALHDAGALSLGNSHADHFGRTCDT